MSLTRPQSIARSHSRASRDSRLFVSQDAILIPEGDVGTSTADMLEAVDPHHESDPTLVGDLDDEPLARPRQPKKPWYKTPSPWWILAGMPLVSIATSSTIAPRVQIYTRLACMAHRPEYMSEEAKLAPTLVDAAWGHASPQQRAEGGVISITLPERAPSLASNNTSSKVPNPSQQCQSDPVVTAAAAQLIALMSSTMGFLGCMTTAWWGQLSDRWGRRAVMRFSVLGLLFADFNFILVSLYSKYLPGGYRFLLMSSIVDGLLGGMGTASSLMHAYVSDCTEQSLRARVFSFSTGLLFAGMAIGPTLGGQIIHATGDLLSVFYIAAGVHIFTSIMWALVVPESLPEEIRAANIYKYKEQQREQADLRAQRGDNWCSINWKAIFGFLAPLTLLLPRARDVQRPEKGKDWNLTFLICAHGCALMLMASYQYKFQYAAKEFHWGPERMGYWLSTVGVARALHLLIVLPVIIKLFKPRVNSPIQLDEEETGLLGSSTRPSASRASSLLRGPHMAHPGSFDLVLARGSLLIDLLSYTGACIATTSDGFTAATVLGAFGGGLSPAILSLALLLFGAEETGKLFGALSVIQTLCGQVIGPIMYGLVVVYTASWFPKGIFVVALVGLIFSFGFLMLVRLPAVPAGHVVDREATLVSDGPSGSQRAKKGPVVSVGDT